jgi:transposase InsO family protein
MGLYDTDEPERLFDPPVRGIDFDEEGAMCALCTFTSPGVTYASEVIGYRPEEQEEIRLLKEEHTPDFQHDFALPVTNDGCVNVNQDVLKTRMYMMLTRNAKVARDVITANARGGHGMEESDGEDAELRPAMFEKGVIENEFFMGEDSIEQTIDSFEEQADKADKELLDFVAKGQQDDDALACIISKIVDRNSKMVFTDKSWYAFFKSQRPYLHVSSRNILYIKPVRSNKYKVMVPAEVVPYLLIDTHEGMGHGSTPRMLGLLEPFVFWRGMRDDVKTHIKRCMICATRQGQGQLSRAPMTSVQVEAVKFARVYADVVKLGESRTGMKYVLTVVDNFTKWVECYPMRTQSAEETAYWMRQYLNRWDLVRSLLTDNGSNFKAEIFEKMLSEKGVKHLFTSPYWPQGDGISERTHRTIMNMLSKHCTKTRVDWCEKLQEVVMFHNKSPNASTGQIPFSLVHCYPPNIVPGNEYMRVANMTTQSTALHDPELQPLIDMFDHAIETAITNMEAGNLLRKTYYDKAHKAKLKLVEGQRVFRLYPPARKGRIYKLARIYCGPFRLVKLRENGSALIKRVDKVALPPIRVNVGHLTHCYEEVPCNRYWNGNTLVAFKATELSGREIVEIKPEWLTGEKEEVEVEVAETQMQSVT